MWCVTRVLQMFRRGVNNLVIGASVGGGVALASCDDLLLHASVFSRHGARTPLSEVDILPIPASAYQDLPQPSPISHAASTYNCIVS